MLAKLRQRLRCLVSGHDWVRSRSKAETETCRRCGKHHRMKPRSNNAAGPGDSASA